MFGAFRLFLAFVVVWAHLGGPSNGPGAVFTFYCLSGFLMTRIMHRTYGYTVSGRGRYFLNRALRIYPTYWIGTIMALGLILVCGEPLTTSLRPPIHWPDGWGQWFSTITMARGFSVRVLPQSWALAVELVFYGLIGLGLSRWLWSTVLALVAGVAYHAYLVSQGTPFPDNYNTTISALLPFALGALIHYLPPARAVRGWQLAVIACLWLFAPGLYWSLMAGAFYVWAAAEVRAPAWDKALGDYSYPVYLLHWNAAIIVSALTGLMPKSPGYGLLAAAVLLLMCALVLRIEKPVTALRESVRAGSVNSNATAPA